MMGMACPATHGNAQTVKELAVNQKEIRMARQITKESEIQSTEKSIDWLCKEVGIEYDGNTTGTQSILGLVFRVCIEQQQVINELKLKVEQLEWERFNGTGN